MEIMLNGTRKNELSAGHLREVSSSEGSPTMMTHATSWIVRVAEEGSDSKCGLAQKIFCLGKMLVASRYRESFVNVARGANYLSHYL